MLEEHDEIEEDVRLILRGDAAEFLQAYKSAEARWTNQKQALEELLQRELSAMRENGCMITSINARVKRFNSAIRSAFVKDPQNREFTWDAVLELRDIIGARIVCLNLNDVIKSVRRVLSIEEFQWNRKDIKNFYQEAKTSRYRTWQVQMLWTPKNGTNNPMYIEVQVRSVLEDAWSEWEHELFYKRRPALSSQAWTSLKLLHDKEKKQISDALFEIANRLDRIRSVFEIASRPLPQHISSFLSESGGHALTDEFAGFIEKQSGLYRLDIGAANLVSGLREEQVLVTWNNAFIGLQNTPVGTLEYRMERAQRFGFDEIAAGAEATLENKKELQFRFDRQGLDQEIVKALDCSFSGKAKALLAICYSKKRDSAQRTFFNEYQVRLDCFRCGANKLNTPSLSLQLSKTNFAYEVCSTYLLDPQRMIAPNQFGEEDEEIRRAKETVLPELETIENKLKAALGNGPKWHYAANPVGVHVNLISWPLSQGSSSEKRLIIMKRGRRAVLLQSQWSTAVSGVVQPLRESIESGGDIPGTIFDADDEAPGQSRPSVFRAVQQELEEELALHVPIDHIRVIGLLHDQCTGQPLIFAEAYTPQSVSQIKSRLGQAQDSWEIEGLCDIALNEAGLSQLFHDDLRKERSEVAEGEQLKPPPPTQTNWHAQGNCEQWGARYAAAILMTFCRHVGAQKVVDRLRNWGFAPNPGV
ncbi:MAG: RelA/SpoT domain-containing protein [Bryobacteraceae bacterium]